jgi:hypothetical protein
VEVANAEAVPTLPHTPSQRSVSLLKHVHNVIVTVGSLLNRTNTIRILQDLRIHGGNYEECRLLRSLSLLLVTANVVPSSPILVTLLMGALSSSETSVLTRATRRNNPEEGILHNQKLLVRADMCIVL